MLTPVDLHYLVGLLSSVGLPADVDLELGAMVFDHAAGKERDVDVTIRRRTPSGVDAFVGIEVKAEKRPLDIIAVEQLSRKLDDMADLTTRAIVSASGYSDPARRKAEHHGIELLRLDDWNPDRQKLGTAIPADFVMHRRGLQFEDKHVVFDIEWEGRAPAGINLGWRVTATNGAPIPTVPNIRALAAGLATQVANAHIKDPAVASLKPGQSRVVQAVVDCPERLRVWAGRRSGIVTCARFTGRAAWSNDTVRPAFKILVRDRDEAPFMGCLIAEMPDGSLVGFGIREQLAPLTIFSITVSDRNKKRIYRERPVLGQRA